MDDIKSTYDLSDAEIGKFNVINKSLEKINEDYKVLFEHGKGRTFAYSKLVEELDGLSNRLTRLQDDLDYRLKSITSMKDDEYRAKEQLNMIEQLLLQAKSKLKDYKIIYENTINNGYKFIMNNGNQTFNKLFNYLINNLGGSSGGQAG